MEGHHAAVRACVQEVGVFEDNHDPVRGRCEGPRLKVIGGHRRREHEPFALRPLLNVAQDLLDLPLRDP
eukprot:11174978-Lingulodinium_polyedra.AAC.1